MADKHTIDVPDGASAVTLTIGQDPDDPTKTTGYIEVRGHVTDQNGTDLPYLVIGTVVQDPKTIPDVPTDDDVKKLRIASGNLSRDRMSYTFLAADGNMVPGAVVGVNYAVTLAKFTGATPKAWVKCYPPSVKFTGN